MIIASLNNTIWVSIVFGAALAGLTIPGYFRRRSDEIKRKTKVMQETERIALEAIESGRCISCRRRTGRLMHDIEDRRRA